MDAGLTVVDSPLDAATIRARVAREVTAAGNTIFADLDQAALARGAGLELRPTFVVIFGNPKAGTPLMVEDARASYELPLKLLIWSDEAGSHVAYRPPSTMGRDYSLSAQRERLAAIDRALAGIVERATTN